MPPAVVPSIAAARLLVGALGERVGWWPSRFTDATAQRTFEKLFPRTAPRAALESVSAVARRDHDETFGPRVTHLFRLPDHLEDRVAAWLASPEADLSWPPADLAGIRAALAPLARSFDPGRQGQVSLGGPGRLARRDALEEMVGCYLASAERGERSIPFFEASA